MNSPVIEIPRSADDFDRPDQSGDDDDEDEELDATDTSRIIAKTKSQRILSKRYASLTGVLSSITILVSYYGSLSSLNTIDMSYTSPKSTKFRMQDETIRILYPKS